INKKVFSTGSNFITSINIGWYAPSNSLAVSFKNNGYPLWLIDFNTYDCFGCDNLPRNNKFIDINNVRASMQNSGVMNYNSIGFNSPNIGCEFPKGSKRRADGIQTLWMGGIDDNAILHTAAQTYRQNGDDFWPGPINVSTGTTDTTTAILYDKIWKINRFDVEEFKWAFTQGTVQNGTYIVPQDIIDWPANGNSVLNQNLAPFFDVNGDGLYAPLQDGDYPIIKGDQMLYFILNDVLSYHQESGGLSLGVEVHASVYAYQCNSLPDSLQVVNNTLFYNFEVINRSNVNYHDFYIGIWRDPDLALYSDDYTATKPELNLNYAYLKFGGANPDSLNEVHKNGCIVLNGPTAILNDNIDNNNNGQTDEVDEKCLMSNGMIYRNDPSAMGNPTAANHFHQYMQSKWKDNSPLTYGNDGYGDTLPVKFGFDGQPWDTTTWNCNVPADWRTVQAAGPVNFLAGDTINFEYAFVNILNSNLPWQSAANFLTFYQDVETIRNLYNQGNIPSCIALDVSTKNNLLSNEIKVFPNPAQQYFVLQSNGENIEQVVIYDLNGRFVLQQQINALQAQIDLADLCNGMLFIQAATKSKNTHFKLMKSN
ncbi:MAG: T9SS type A sorting domain-containing protein, partial [Bacteroidota bacterium]